MGKGRAGGGQLRRAHKTHWQPCLQSACIEGAASAGSLLLPPCAAFLPGNAALCLREPAPAPPPACLPTHVPPLPAHPPPACPQDILEAGEVRTDASGNPILKDVGPWMKSEMKRHFKDCDVKYIDPS